MHFILVCPSRYIFSNSLPYFVPQETDWQELWSLSSFAFWLSALNRWEALQGIRRWEHKQVKEFIASIPFLPGCCLAVVFSSYVKAQLLSELYFLWVQVTAPSPCRFMPRRGNRFSLLLSYVSC